MLQAAFLSQNSTTLDVHSPSGPEKAPGFSSSWISLKRLCLQRRQSAGGGIWPLGAAPLDVA